LGEEASGVAGEKDAGDAGDAEEALGVRLWA